MGCGGSTFTIGIIDGSLKKNSNNKGLTRFLETLKPEDCNIQYLDIHDIPLFNEDLEKKLDGYKRVEFPGTVERLRNSVRSVDALIFSSPEYNGGISGALKNAYDWLSRDFTAYGGTEISPMKDKKLGIIGASYISQNSLKDAKQMTEYLKVPVFEETFYTKLGPNFDDKGNLVNEEQKKKLKEWALKFWKFALPEQPKAVPIK